MIIYNGWWYIHGVGYSWKQNVSNAGERLEVLTGFEETIVWPSEFDSDSESEEEEDVTVWEDDIAGNVDDSIGWPNLTLMLLFSFWINRM